MHGQSVRWPSCRLDRPAHRLDIATRDPQSDTEIARRGFVGAALGIVALENLLYLLGGHSRTLIGHGEVSEATVAGEVYDNLAAWWRERDRIIDQVFDDGFDHFFGAEHEQAGQKICGNRQIMARKNDRHVATGKHSGSDLDQPA